MIFNDLFHPQKQNKYGKMICNLRQYMRVSWQNPCFLPRRFSLWITVFLFGKGSFAKTFPICKCQLMKDLPITLCPCHLLTTTQWVCTLSTTLYTPHIFGAGEKYRVKPQWTVFSIDSTHLSFDLLLTFSPGTCISDRDFCSFSSYRSNDTFTF